MDNKKAWVLSQAFFVWVRGYVVFPTLFAFSLPAIFSCLPAMRVARSYIRIFLKIPSGINFMMSMM